MKKVKKFLIGNIKTVVAFILGGLIIGGSVYAATILFQSNIVGYNNARSGLSATNVQDALDELYNKTNRKLEPTQVATLTTQGATYTMQHDGYLIGTVSSTTGTASGNVYIDNVEIYRVNWTDAGVFNASIYAQKGAIIRTRATYGTYNLTVYEFKNN